MSATILLQPFGKKRLKSMTPKNSLDNKLPFPKRWLYFIAAKILVLAVLVYGALRWKGLV